MINADQAEKIIEQQIGQWVQDPQLFCAVTAKVNDLQRDQNQPDQKKMYQARLDELAYQQQQTILEYENNQISQADIVVAMQQYKAERAAILAAMESLSKEPEVTLQVEVIPYQQVRHYLRNFHRLWKTATNDRKKELIRTLFRRVVLDKENQCLREVQYAFQIAPEEGA